MNLVRSCSPDNPRYRRYNLKHVIRAEYLQSFLPANASECSRECSPFGLFYLKGRNILFIGNKEYFLDQVLHVPEVLLQYVLSEAEQYYRAFQIPKSGGTRTIQAIDKESLLYQMQKNLNRNFLGKIPLPIPAVGFVKDESYLTFLKPHVGKNIFSGWI